MAKTQLVTVQKNLDHPLEDVFDIEPGTTLITRVEQQTELTPIDVYDEKDAEIEEQMQEVYDKAISGYGIIQDECEDIEGKFKARMMEVGVQHLKMALDAAEAKARMKEMKDKLKTKAATKPASTVNNNLFVNREDLLKTLMGPSDDDQDVIIPVASD